MIATEQACNFAREWVEAWNSHDLERILSHYTEDFEMSSPFILQFTGEAKGTLKGKAAVGAYWQAALDRMPDLHFELLDVFTGVDTITILYKAVQGKQGMEVLFFNASGKVYKAIAHYNS